MNKRIAILLPYKEDYNKNNAGSASLWVKDFFENSKLKKITTIYGINTKKKSLSKNFVNLNNKFPLFTFKKNIFYAKLFLKNIHKKTKIIEIHNRPEIFHFINKQNSNYKLILVFHNNPLLIRGSKKIKERKITIEYIIKVPLSCTRGTRGRRKNVPDDHGAYQLNPIGCIR